MKVANRHVPLILFLLILATIFFGCGQVGLSSKRVDFDSVKAFINNRIDELYKTPERAIAMLDSMQADAADSSTIELVELYRSFCQYHTDNNLDSAIRIIRKVDEYCRRNPDDLRLRAVFWNHLSIFAPTIDSTVACLERSRRCFEDCNDTKGQITANINLADNHRLMGHLPVSAQYWHRALTMADSLGIRDIVPDIAVGLAQVYSEMGRYDMADKYFAMTDSLAAGERLHYLLYMAQGNSYYNRKEYDMSLAFFHKALSTLNSLPSNFHLLPIYIDIAELYTLKDSYDSAHFYLDKAREALDGNIVPNADFYYYSLSADLAYREKRDKDAAAYLDTLERMENVSLTYLFQHKRRMMEHFARTGNYAQAYAYRNEMDRYDDSIRNVQKQANIAEQEFRYHRDTMLLHQRLVADRSRIILLFVLLAFILVLGTTERLWVKRQRNAKEARRRAQSRIAELRMQGVRNRVTPHLFFNALQAARLKGTDPVYERLIDVLRDNIMTGDSACVTLEDELRIVEHYIALYNDSHSIKPTVSITRLGEAERTLMLPGMSIQLPVENALKHAFTSQTSDPHIEVSLTLSDNVLHATITDNGQGYDPTRRNKGENSTGAGMNILYQTIELLNQFNHEKIRFNIVSPALEGHGTRVEIDVPQDYDYSFHNQQQNNIKK